MDRSALAEFLRTRREALQPDDVGLLRGPRRRARGLRREEVAMLADMSTDYYSRIEQQRGPQPSPAMLAAIARALRLTVIERDHVFRMAGHSPPASDVRSDYVAPGTRRLLDRIDAPTMVTNDLGEVLAQNRLAVALFGDESRFDAGDPDRSRFHRWFMVPGERSLHPDAEHARYSRAYVAALHLAAGRHPGDAHGREVLDRLLAGSAEFARLWAEQAVTARPGSERKTFLHPEVGEMQLDCETLRTDDDTQIVLVYTATPGTRSAERLALLDVIGSQRFAAPLTPAARA